MAGPFTRPESASVGAVPAPLGGTRAQAMQRLQVGASLLVGIVLVVGLANVIEDRAKQADAQAVPDAASTVEATAAAPAVDPLADAGVVPDLPAESSVAPTGPARPEAAIDTDPNEP